MRVHVLRSPRAGGRRSRASARQVLETLGHAGHELIDLTGDSPRSSRENLRLAIEGGKTDLVLVAGGDGLVHLAIQELARSTVPLALAPSGTGNDFASALGITAIDLDTITATAQSVDLMRIHGEDGFEHWVGSIAIAGFPAAINARANRLHLPLGAQIYTVAAALELPRFRRTLISLRIDGHRIETDSAMLAIGNTSLFGGGMLACPDALPTDGLLHLTSIQDVGRVGILRHLLGRAGGTADRPEVLRRTATRIDLDSVGIDVWGDGEPIGTGPLSFTIEPGALQVVGSTV